VIVIAIAAGVINSPLGGGPDETKGPSEGPGITGSGGTRLPIANAESLDPFGDDQEHDEDLQLAFDGDPATFWETEGYNSPTLDKAGVGIAFDLGRSARVTGFKLMTPLPGWTFELRVGNDLAALPDATGPKFTAADGLRRSIPAATGRYVVVWVTRTVPAPDGENRAEVAEFSVVGVK
jgi:hypothetical protein